MILIIIPSPAKKPPEALSPSSPCDAQTKDVHSEIAVVELAALNEAAAGDQAIRVADEAEPNESLKGFFAGKGIMIRTIYSLLFSAEFSYAI